MACEAYKDINFKSASLRLIETINGIVDEYSAQNFRLTVRQLYYQLVARDVVPNTLQSYKNVASLVNDARVAGLVDWDAIEDRTREFLRRSRWDNGAQLLEAAANQFHMDMWEGQDSRCFVIIEKEALVGVLEPICRQLDVPILAARGYPSGTVLREFALADIVPCINAGEQHVVIFHLGDHDPSGIDMTRDLEERLSMFSYQQVELVRLALTMPQIEERKPPPNPAKTTDSRFRSYMELYGTESWELDALPPTYLSELVGGEIAERIDAKTWKARQDEIEDIKRRMLKAAKAFR